MRKIVAAMVAVAALPSIANAASLVSPPVTGYNTGNVECSINYLGKSTTSIQILITIKEGSKVLAQRRASVSSRNQFSGVLETCSGASMHTCDGVTCAFSFTGDKELFSASACFNGGSERTTASQFCMAAY